LVLTTTANVLIISALVVWGARLLDRAEDERRREAESRRDAEQQYRSIFKNVAEGIYQTTLDGRLLAANPAMALIFGYESPEDMIASVSDVSQQLWADPKQRAEFLRRVHQQGKIPAFEGKGRRRDGREVWFSLSGTFMRDDLGNVIGLEGIIHDITERREAEEALRRNNTLVRLLRTVAAASNEAYTVEEAMQGCIDQVCVFTGWPL
jgi:PAS domain S-box-containing protein